MSPETKLKAAMEDIKDICRKYDIAGSFTLHTTPGNGEFAIVINPSYSCAYPTDDQSVNFYSKKENYASEEEQYLHQENTANMLKILTETTLINYKTLLYLSTEIDKITGAIHD